MVKVRVLILGGLLSVASLAHAGEKSSSNTKMPMIFFGIGSGTFKIISPKDEIDPSGFLFFEIGGQMPVFPKFSLLQFSVAAFAGLTSGKVQYQYLSEAQVQYSASDINYQMSNVGVRAGLQFRVINTGGIRVYAEGGGYTDSSTINYETLGTTLVTQGSTYQKSQKDVVGSGWYSEGGLDLRIVKVGIRAAVRQMNGNIGKVKALDDQKIKYQTNMALVSFFKEF